MLFELVWRQLFPLSVGLSIQTLGFPHSLHYPKKKRADNVYSRARPSVSLNPMKCFIVSSLWYTAHSVAQFTQHM